MSARNPDRPLTCSEITVLRLVGEGLSNIEIGQRLHISPHTVKSHLGRILGHLRVPTRAAAVLEAHRRGLLGMALVPLVQPPGSSPDGAVFGEVTCDRVRATRPIRTVSGAWISTDQAAAYAAALLSAVHYAQGGQL